MLKKSILSLGALFLLIGCGSDSDSSSNKNSLSDKDGIVIFYSYPEDICSSTEFERRMGNTTGAKNILIKVESNSVTCATYKKTEGQTCFTDNSINSGNKSCVVGYDVDNNGQQKISTSIIEEIRDTAISAN